MKRWWATSCAVAVAQGLLPPATNCGLPGCLSVTAGAGNSPLLEPKMINLSNSQSSQLLSCSALSVMGLMVTWYPRLSSDFKNVL
jgi:hypothetical protein